MALTYGFFNSVDSDRVYNADQMSKYFKGLVSNGVYMNVGGAYKVTASGDGLSVNVAPGRAIIDCKWAESDAIETVSITAADPSKARYTAITLRLSYGDRLIALGTHDGVAAASPVKPMPIRNADNYEIILAYVLVPAGATTISQAQVIDMRADSSVCGWVSGLIDQVDVGDLFDQFNTAYQQMLVDMQQWQVAQKAQYEEWFATLTDDLVVGAICDGFNKIVTYPANSGPGKSIALNDIEGYTYKNGDIIMVYINGLMSIEGIDYDLVDISGVKTVVFRTLDVRALPCTAKVQILQSKASGGGGGGGGGDYSTTEHKTGRKWIDGNDIWEITINVPLFNASYEELRINSYYGVLDLENYIGEVSRVFPILEKTYITLSGDDTPRLPIYIDWQGGASLSILFPFAPRTGTLTLTVEYIK